MTFERNRIVLICRAISVGLGLVQVERVGALVADASRHLHADCDLTAAIEVGER